MSDQISLEFRPETGNGILLLTGERDDLSGDFLALYVRDSYLEFRFDCGSGSGMVRSSQPVKLEQWNRASIVRRRWEGWMQLNDGPFTQGRSKVSSFSTTLDKCSKKRVRMTLIFYSVCRAYFPASHFDSLSLSGALGI